MHPLLRTLDLSASAGTESSVHDLHPILLAAPARARALPALLSLVLTPLLVLGLALGLVQPPQSLARLGPGALPKSVTLLLAEVLLPTEAKPPVRNLVGPDAPGGDGHREGTDTIDPRLVGLKANTLAMPSDAIDPDALTLSPRAEPVSLSLNPALPVRVGGDGLASGTGRDAARGNGGRLRPLPVHDFLLVAIRQVPLYHRLGPGETDRKEPTRVRLLIGEDGVPIEATAISGPAFLLEKARKAALEWRFEPLSPHGLKPPFVLTLTFYPVPKAAR